ncbi:hypothetical protein M3196_17505 [Fictibacillus nanhaiensis]|uniref:hypothetical protein n=1 Tax=Fictibacillus nanhaiensis TaxID=742169 RepID=UPI00203F5160|nr:hypothetical protein [Fictibacillus nanhaiensis]MCM3733447.1 hypothetical protein [Fictibacillus nanhaiensis]
MENQIGVKFTYYRMGTTISRMTGLENMEEVMESGFETVASDCIHEVFSATGIDLNKLSHPHPATRFCFLSELRFHPEKETLIEGKQIWVSTEREKAIG